MEWHDVVWYEIHWICSFDDNTKINQICRFVLCQQHYGHHVEFKLYQTSFYRTIRAVFGFPRPVLHLIISSLNQTAENVETRIVLNEKYHKNLHCDKAKSKHHDSVLTFKKNDIFSIKWRASKTNCQKSNKFQFKSKDNKANKKRTNLFVNTIREERKNEENHRAIYLFNKLRKIWI